MRLAHALRKLVVKDEGSVQALSQAELEVTKDDRSDCSGKTKVCTVTGGCQRLGLARVTVQKTHD